jgi:SH3-like domain-containing protein
LQAENSCARLPQENTRASRATRAAVAAIATRVSDGAARVPRFSSLKPQRVRRVTALTDAESVVSSPGRALDVPMR